MSNQTLKTRLNFDHGHITYPGEVNEENALELRNKVGELADDYYYCRVEVEIVNNRGGLVSAMQMLGRKFKELQARGVTVATQGVGTVASAAAITLSSGTLSERSVISGTRLVYHLGRMQTNEIITSNTAQIIGKQLEEIDEETISALVNHILPLAKCPEEKNSPGSQTSQQAGWLWPLETISDPAFKRLNLKSRRSASSQACAKHMFNTLLDIFAVDCVMKPETARALGLIDQINA